MHEMLKSVFWVNQKKKNISKCRLLNFQLPSVFSVKCPIFLIIWHTGQSPEKREQIISFYIILFGRPRWISWMRRPTGDQKVAGSTPRLGRQHSFVEIDHEIFSTVILSLPLIQEGQLSVSGERMCTILVNRLED